MTEKYLLKIRAAQHHLEQSKGMKERAELLWCITSAMNYLTELLAEMAGENNVGVPR